MTPQHVLSPGQIPDYHDCAQALARLRVGMEAAECHGSLSGMLCAAGDLRADVCLDALFQGAGEQGSAPSLPTAGMAVLEKLFAATASALNDPDFGFQLLLPDDGHPLQTRAEALSLWCQGFLGGLGLAGFSDGDFGAGEVREVLHDFSEIARMDHDDMDTGEEGENAYMEVVEYVRMAVLLAHEELGRKRQTPAGKRATH
ncbi:MAG TPA: YecA family protein [Gammaproteobacteria bacterium]|nr:YecA family protein [Gammaproteobacteria bacterium]